MGDDEPTEDEEGGEPMSGKQYPRLTDTLSLDCSDDLLVHYEGELIRRFGVHIKTVDGTYKDQHANIVENETLLHALSANKIVRWMLDTDAQRDEWMGDTHTLKKQVDNWKTKYIEAQAEGSKDKVELNTHIRHVTQQLNNAETAAYMANQKLGKAEAAFEQLSKAEATNLQLTKQLTEANAMIQKLITEKPAAGGSQVAEATPTLGGGGISSIKAIPKMPKGGEEIMAAIGAAECIGCSKLARNLGQNKGSMYQKLQALCHLGAVRKNEDNTYSLS